MQGGPQRPVHAVLQVQLAAPPDDVREQVAVERRVLGQQLLQIKCILGGDELIEANGTGRDLSPFPGSAGMIGIGPPVTDLLKDHVSSLVEDPVPPLAATIAHPPRIVAVRLAPGLMITPNFRCSGAQDRHDHGIKPAPRADYPGPRGTKSPGSSMGLRSR